MNYSELPIFKGITPEAAAYIDRFDDLTKKYNNNLSDEEIFLRKISLFSDYMDDDANKKDLSKFSENVERRLHESAKGNYNHDVKLFLFFRGLYGVRRFAKNDTKISSQEYYSMLENWKTKSSELEVSYGSGNVASGWVYKTHPKYYEDSKKGKDVHRFILNVDPSSQLFEKLDDFAIKYHCQYKCAESKSSAYERPDTIVIYTADGRLDEQKKELAGIIKPYIRKNGNELLDGEKISDGFHIASERSREDIKKLIEKSNKIYPRLGEYLDSILLNNPKRNHPLSLGEFTVLEDFYKSIEILKNPERTRKDNQQSLDVSDIYKEGVKNNFSVLPSQESSLRTEMKSTATAEFKTDHKNPDVMNIEGTDKDGKHTFSFRVDKTTGYYTYAGGKPEKIFSNEPGTRFSPLPEADLDCLKYNNRLSKTVANRNVILKRGVQYKDGDKTVTVFRPKDGMVEIRVVGADGKPASWFCINTKTNEYRAKNFKAGKKYSNMSKDKGKGYEELPGNLMDLCKVRANKAAVIAKNMAMTLGNANGKDKSITK